MAKQEGSKAAVTALEGLILDWPVDLVHVKGAATGEIEENMFKWAVNVAARRERIHDFVGLQHSNLLRVVARAADIARGSGPAGGQPKAENVQEWMQAIMKWGLLQCPDVKAAQRRVSNWAALQKSQVAMQLMEGSVTRFIYRYRRRRLVHQSALSVVGRSLSAWPQARDRLKQHRRPLARTPTWS